MASEKRKNARSGLSMENQEGQFNIEKDQESFSIKRIRDVSISGVGLEMSRALPVGEQLSLSYNSGDFQLSILGTVIWCNPETQSGPYILGIEFNPESRENNALFFLAIRKYLDEFDGAYMDA